MSQSRVPAALRHANIIGFATHTRIRSTQRAFACTNMRCQQNVLLIRPMNVRCACNLSSTSSRSGVLFFLPSATIWSSPSMGAAGHRTHQQSHHWLLAKLKNSLAPRCSIPLSLCLCIWVGRDERGGDDTNVPSHLFSLYMKYWPDAVIMMAFTMGPIILYSCWLYFKCAWAKALV